MDKSEQPTRPYPYPRCTCAHEWQPAVPGTFRRFGTWEITDYNRDCLDHGHIFSEYGLAAALRYDLPIGTR